MTRHEFTKKWLILKRIFLFFLLTDCLGSQRIPEVLREQTGDKLESIPSLFSKLWADLRRKTRFNQKRFYWWRYLSFRLNSGPCMLITPSHFSEVACCIKSSGETMDRNTRGGEGLANGQSIRQLARSSAVPRWVRRPMLRSGLADL